MKPLLWCDSATEQIDVMPNPGLSALQTVISKTFLYIPSLVRKHLVPGDGKGVCRGLQQAKSHVTQVVTRLFTPSNLLTTHLFCQLFDTVFYLRFFLCWQEYTQRISQAFLNTASKQRTKTKCKRKTKWTILLKSLKRCLQSEADKWLTYPNLWRCRFCLLLTRKILGLKWSQLVTTSLWLLTRLFLYSLLRDVARISNTLVNESRNQEESGI